MHIDYQKALHYAIIAQEVYADFEGIVFEAFPDVESALFIARTTDTQAAVIPASNDEHIVVFRGTKGLTDWRTNIRFSRELFQIRKPANAISNQPTSRQILPAEQIMPVDIEGNDLAEIAPRAQMHNGFVDAYMSIQNEIHRYVDRHRPKRLVMTGHSLGGALATLCAIDFQLTYKGRHDIALYTYGSPRVGNPAFRELVNEHIPESYRIVHGVDFVPGLPAIWSGYRHVNSVYRIGNRFNWRFFSSRVTDHFMQKYRLALEELV